MTRLKVTFLNKTLKKTWVDCQGQQRLTPGHNFMTILTVTFLNTGLFARERYITLVIVAVTFASQPAVLHQVSTQTLLNKCISMDVPTPPSPAQFQDNISSASPIIGRACD